MLSICHEIIMKMTPIECELKTGNTQYFRIMSIHLGSKYTRWLNIKDAKL